MCCSVIALLFLGPRVGLLIWWLLPSGRDQFTLAFDILDHANFGNHFPALDNDCVDVILR